MTTFISTVILIIPLSAMAQHGGAPQHRSPPQQMAPRANQGHLPPAPAEHVPSVGGERLGSGRINTTPHVNHDQWYGHDAPNDSRSKIQTISAGICSITCTLAPTFTFNIWECSLASRLRTVNPAGDQRKRGQSAL